MDQPTHDGAGNRAKLTDYWANHEIKAGQEFAILTNLIHEKWTGLGVKDHKQLKGLKTQNLRDHMSEAELIFTALAELSTRQIAETTQATGMPANKVAAKSGGAIAKRARLELESQTGKKGGDRRKLSAATPSAALEEAEQIARNGKVERSKSGEPDLAFPFRFPLFGTYLRIQRCLPRGQPPRGCTLSTRSMCRCSSFM